MSLTFEEIIGKLDYIKQEVEHLCIEVIEPPDGKYLSMECFKDGELELEEEKQRVMDTIDILVGELKK